jgi:hypothetical protein
MKINELSTLIDKKIETRFIKEKANALTKQLLSLDENIETKNLIRIKRANKESLLTWKTILLVQLEDKESLKDALQWTAAVKNALTDPETSDLYLFLISDNNIFSIDESMRIEATEQFCKKYVQRKDETPQCLIRRTFLSGLSMNINGAIQIDPVDNALLETGHKFVWFDESIQRKWKKAFFSEDTGNELLDQIK